MNTPSRAEITACRMTPALWEALDRKRVTPEEVNLRCPGISVLCAQWELDRARCRRKRANREVSRILSGKSPVIETPVQEAVAHDLRSSFSV